ncbi:MAG TPA: DUF4407 domain-containing protein [Trebonia sp.]|jgi:hypothetical protein
MAGNGGLDPTLVYSYDDSLLDTPLNPLTPMASAGGSAAGGSAARGQDRGGQRQDAGPRPRWPIQWRPHPGAWLGGGLLFLASVDPTQLGSRGERYRYHTIAVLMLLTGVQACYSATLFMSMSLGKPMHSEIWFGLVFAAAVVFLDRSIISYAPKVRLHRKTRAPLPPKKFSPMLVVRLVIAVSAAMLMSEMILLQVFAGDINEQILVNQLSAKHAATGQIEANYGEQIAALKEQINQAQTNVNQQQTKVNTAYHEMTCEEFGCPGIGAGIGPGFRAAAQIYGDDEVALKNAQSNLQEVRGEIQPKIHQDVIDESNDLKAAQGTISNANKILSQEEAFWQLTIEHGTVAVTRLLLTLLILGIDLGPILGKLTGRTSLHDIRAYYGDFAATEKERLNVTTALSNQEGQAGLDQQVHELETGDALFTAQLDSDVARAKVNAEGEVSRYQIDLDAHRSMLWLHHDYLAGKPGRPQDDAGRTARQRPSRRGARRRDAFDPDEAVTAVLGQQSPWADTAERPPGPVGADWYSPPVGPPAAGTDPFAPPPAPPAPPPDPAPPRPGRASSLWVWSASQIEQAADIFSRQNAAAPADDAGHWVLGGRWVMHGALVADKGGGGHVWRARDRRQGDQSPWYVVKTVPSGQADRMATASIQQLGLLHEERAAAVISEHVGQVLDHGDDSGFYYLVYPLYEPGSLSQYCRQLRGRRTLNWCAQVIHEVLSGLMAAAEAGLVHLDIKPGNIVMDGNRARVIDWGLSRKFDANRPSTWVARGTPFFACPEQMSGSKPGWDTPRADLYGVGATFYWLLTGEAPLQHDARGGEDPFGYRSLIMAGVRPQRVHELVLGVPLDLSELIDRWLSVNPADRVPEGTPVRDSIRMARGQLDVLLPGLPDMTVGRVSGRRRGEA